MSKISIVVPVYGVEQYLEECVDSLINQTFKDIEIILVDDGSPDNCGSICDAFATRYPQIRVIHQENSGLSVARNIGIDSSSGEYICFVDSDDMVAPDYCQRLYEFLDGSLYDFSFCGVCRFQDGEVPASGGQDTELHVANIQYLKMQLERKSEFGVWNKLFRKDIFKHIRFESGRIHEDVIFSAELAGNLHHGVIYTTKELYFYRQRENGIVSTHKKKCSPDRIYAGECILRATKNFAPELIEIAAQYAIEYPWMFIDPIYVNRSFKKNKSFMDAVQQYLKDNIQLYKQNNIFSDIQTRRLDLFSKSKFLYGFNAYARLIRLYIYRLFRRDAYSDGHGI